MEITFSQSFKRSFRKRIKGTPMENEFWLRTELFIQNPFEDRLRTHRLSGKLKDLWSFSLEYDLRVVLYFTKEKPKRAVFIDVGSHSEVY